MVRLKANKQEEIGAVLETFQFLMVRLKVFYAKDALENGLIFQFLMVRLKAAHAQFCNAHAYISIPYGAIKSFGARSGYAAG